MTADLPRRAAIVGAHVVTALGDGLAETLSALLEGRSGIAPVAGFDASGTPDAVAAQLVAEPEGAAAEGPTRVETPHGALLERCARAAHAAGRGAELPREAIGAFVALGMVDSPPDAMDAAIAASAGDDGAFALDRFFGGGFRSIHPHWPLAMLNNVAAGQLAADLDLRGDNLVVTSEADAGVRAFAEALCALSIGAVRAALVAGIADHVGAAALLRAAERGTPGEVLGEGGGALLLEGERDARARGVPILGFVTGAASAFGPSEVGPGPSARAIERAARGALADAGVPVERVGLLFVEGTGVEEADARRALFGARRAAVAVVAPAMALGHLRAGAPAVHASLAAGMLRLGTAPSTAQGRPRRIEPGGVALVLASGSGGGAAALVVEGPS